MMRQERSVADLCVFLGADAPIKIESYRLPDIPTRYDWDAFTEDALFTRMSHRWAQIWDPVSGKRYIPRQQGNRVHVQLEADQTLFIVCSDSKDSLPPFPATILSSDTLSRDWTVNFDKNKGGNGENMFDKLRDWTESKCPGIRYYSGTAVYQKAFTCKAPSPGQRVSWPSTVCVICPK